MRLWKWIMAYIDRQIAEQAKDDPESEAWRANK